MHLQQTKRGSRITGGPQYYFHDLSEPIKGFLRKKGVVRVALQTPYGATTSDYLAVGMNHKLDPKTLGPIPGRVGHDRIQQGSANESIGESIRKWFLLPAGDFERIDVDIDIRDDAFYVTPKKCKYVNNERTKTIPRVDHPLSYTRHYRSPLWKEQIKQSEKTRPGIVSWSIQEIGRIVKDHTSGSRISHVQESDLLRASGPLKHLGVALGAYVGKGYDCVSHFTFMKYPRYGVPVEIKKRSSRFSYQEKKYGKDELSRAIILCAHHDHQHLPPNIDVIELAAFHESI